MKKVFTILGLVIISIVLTGCKSDSMEDIQIYTSVYPIEFVTSKLYGDYSKITNMYPQGIIPYDYKFTNKQISDFSKADLVIYNGLENEKDAIVEMVNNNKQLKIIDATSKIEYSYNIDEIWINPSNILMITNNIKEGLEEYVSSDLLIKNIENNYENLKLELSSIDAKFKEIAENASDKNILVSTNQFNFLSKYGFNVISLDDTTFTEGYYNTADSLIKDGEIKYIYMKKNEEDNEYIKKLKENNPDLETVYIDTLNNISTSDKNAGIDYLTIMNDNLDNFRKEFN